MAHPVQFRSKLSLLFIFLALSACHHKPVSMGRFAMSDTRFKQQTGFLYFKGMPFTGIAYELYPNGDTVKSVPYQNGKENGIVRCWHPNKQLAQLRPYVNGWKQGIHKGWWPNGIKQFEYHFVNDEYQGAVTEWYSNGRPFRVFTYKAGHEDGRQQMWWEDGKVRANYAIVNGEKFGLFGQKMCINATKGNL